MKQIYNNLYIGSQYDYENIVKYQDGWFIIHACKEPYHRQALGYLGQGAPTTDPEYLFAYRGDHLILNLVDAPTVDYIPKPIIDEAIKAIKINIQKKKVFVHCNQGGSRSAVIGLLYLKAVHAISDDFVQAEKAFLQLYPCYSPGKGMRMFAMRNWTNY